MQIASHWHPSFDTHRTFKQPSISSPACVQHRKFPPPNLYSPTHPSNHPTPPATLQARQRQQQQEEARREEARLAAEQARLTAQAHNEKEAERARITKRSSSTRETGAAADGGDQQQQQVSRSGAAWGSSSGGVSEQHHMSVDGRVRRRTSGETSWGASNGRCMLRSGLSLRHQRAAECDTVLKQWGALHILLACMTALSGGWCLAGRAAAWWAATQPLTSC